MTHEAVTEPIIPLSSVEEFDLREIAERQYRSNRFGRWFFLGMAVAFTFFFFVVLPTDLNLIHLALTGRISIHDPLGDLVVVCAVAFVDLLSASGMRMCRYGPVSLVLDSDAARFRYRNGRETAWRWSSRQFRLDLYDVRGALDWVASVKPQNLTWVDNGFGSFLTPLTGEAFDALIENAQSHGLRVSIGRPTFLQLVLVKGMLPRNARICRVRGTPDYR